MPTIHLNIYLNSTDYDKYKIRKEEINATARTAFKEELARK